MGGNDDMPTYEYHCKECGHQFEIEQRITDEPLMFAPDCASSSPDKCKLEKLLFVPVIKFKGEGWTPKHHK